MPRAFPRAVKLALAAVVITTWVGVAAPPSEASTGLFSASGDATFNGRAWLPQFPCTSGCGGSFAGTWTGTLSGVNNDAAYTVSWKTVADRVSASFGYSESLCGGPASGAVLGHASGSVHAWASADAAEVVGTWHSVNPGELPRLITAVSLDAGFEWERVGNDAVLVLRPTAGYVWVTGLGWRQVLWGTQRGAATFVPTHADAPPTGVVSCDTPLTNVTGEISGNVPLTLPSA